VSDVRGRARPRATPLADRLLPRCDLPDAGTSVTCAVSGGPDSLALLVLAARAGCTVTAVHVDHALREGSAAEADVVAHVAASVGASFRAVRTPVAPGPNVEARARAARYAALPPGVLTGHTADDQAETVLLALLRGAGLDGLAGFDPATRPLRHLRRRDTRALCAEVGVTPLVDPMNTDPALRRTRVRSELLPLLDAIAEREVAPVLARQAELFHDEAAFLDDLALAVDPTDARELAAAPAVLARRAVRRWLRAEVGGDEQHPPDRASVERVLAVARGDVRATEVCGARVARTAGRLRIEHR
jgi:tRNA(Ile)-lysidine synthase